MRTVHATHRWNLSSMECFSCRCATNSELALLPCTAQLAAPARVQQPKAPDLLSLSRDEESRKP